MAESFSVSGVLILKKVYGNYIEGENYDYFPESVKTDGAKKAKKFFCTALVGLFIGAVNGFFGGGGGMLVVPVLTALFNLEEKKAHATAIAVILPLCLVSGIIYCVKGAFVLETGGPSALGIVIGGIAGALLLKSLSNGFLKLLFYGIMLAAGVKMIL